MNVFETVKQSVATRQAALLQAWAFSVDGGSGRKVGPNDVETNQQVSPRLRLKSMGLRQPRDCLMRSRLYQCR